MSLSILTGISHNGRRKATAPIRKSLCDQDSVLSASTADESKRRLITSESSRAVLRIRSADKLVEKGKRSSLLCGKADLLTKTETGGRFNIEIEIFRRKEYFPLE
jgi:hypothetical protein